MTASTGSVPGRIFMSYRREDTAYPAGWLYDRLVGHFGRNQVFKDIDSIELGDNFVEVITAAVGSCNVLLALIGDRWLTVTGQDGRPRLDDPGDFVRLEIEAALTRDVRVIPILVERARMPRADELPPSLAKLARRQALELSPSRFDADTRSLLRVLDRTITEAQEQARQEVERTEARHQQQIEPPREKFRHDAAIQVRDGVLPVDHQLAALAPPGADPDSLASPAAREQDDTTAAEAAARAAHPGLPAIDDDQGSLGPSPAPRHPQPQLPPQTPTAAKRSRTRIWLLAVAAIVAASVTAIAISLNSGQVHADGTLTGHLYGVGGPAPGSPRPWPGTVTLTGPGVHRDVAVGASGTYSVMVPAGRYTVAGHSPAYDSGAGLCQAAGVATVTSGHSTKADVLCQMA